MLVQHPPGCLFPRFREKFFAAALGSQQEEGTASRRSEQAASVSRGPAHPQIAMPGRQLRMLDLASLPREDAPPNELQARRDKLAFFEHHCSEVADGLMVAGSSVAADSAILRASRVSHILNCVGALLPCHFPKDFTYKVLYLQDAPSQDISCILYEAFDFFEVAMRHGGRVLVHCSQGVSRSAALAIAYLMWQRNEQYDPVFQQVKAIRGVANPNIGFTCQLLTWHKRRQQAIVRPRIYRIAPQSPAAPGHLVPKLLSSDNSILGSPQPGTNFGLDPRGAFVIHSQDHLYVWQGQECHEGMAEAGTRAAERLVRYEGAAEPVISIHQGQEPLQLLSALGVTDGAGLAHVPVQPAYNSDFELYEAALNADPELEEAAAAVAQEHAESRAPPPAVADQQGPSQPAEAASDGSAKPAAARPDSCSELRSRLPPQRPVPPGVSSPAKHASGSRSKPGKPADTPASLAGQLQAPMRPTLNPLFRDFTATPRIANIAPTSSARSMQQEAAHEDAGCSRNASEAGSAAALANQLKTSLSHTQSFTHAVAEAGQSRGPSADAPAGTLSDNVQASASKTLSAPGEGHARERLLGIPSSPARPSSYAAAAAAAASASSSPAKVPRRSSGASPGIRAVGGQTERTAGRQQPPLRAASMTPPRRRTSGSCADAAPSGAQTHRGAPPAMHRLSGSGSADVSRPVANAESDPSRASVNVVKIGSSHAGNAFKADLVAQMHERVAARRPSQEIVSRATKVPQLNFGPMQQPSSEAMFTPAAMATLPNSAAQKLVPHLSLGSMQQPSSEAMIASAAKQMPANAVIHKLVPRLSIGEMQQQGRAAVTRPGGDRVVSTSIESGSERPLSAGSARSYSSSSTHPSSDESRGRSSGNSGGNPAFAQAASRIPRLQLDMSQLPGNLSAVPAVPTESHAPPSRSGALTSRLYRTSGSSGSGSSQGDASDGRPLTARMEKKSRNPFACLLRMSGAANLRSKHAGAKDVTEGVAASARSETGQSSTEERPPLSARRPKTPRDEPTPAANEAADAHTSPNQRVRKHARPSELAGPGEYVASNPGNDASASVQALPPAAGTKSRSNADAELTVTERCHSEASSLSMRVPKLNFKGALLKGPR
ncbi:hypothetical protein WJX74_010479 [Apatococcus lobatus]|uniref:Uncharacterized protein n=1 Tax=Apatococcus lobatus TaxID=904363 RepID=A0AAW1RN48_9CHLO